MTAWISRCAGVSHAVPFQFIAEVFQVMTGECSPSPMEHTFQILTKRPERMLEFFRWAKSVYLDECNDVLLPFALMTPFSGKLTDNVWLGVSCEDQETADRRIPLLLLAPAQVRFVSCEPLLEDIDLRLQARNGEILHWVIVGGESGAKARPMSPFWALDIRKQCKNAGVAFFMKQGSQTWGPSFKKMDQWMPEIRVREYPKQ